MDKDSLRTLIQAKLADGRLPHDSIPRMSGGPGNDETCVACEETVTKMQLVMEGVGALRHVFQFHVVCFYLWDVERRGPGGQVKMNPDLSL
jgi:hypothetical protein